jgi:hypothetical protein
MEVIQDTKNGLVEHARKGGALRHGNPTERADFSSRVAEMLQMIAATAEYQFA